MEQEKPLMTPFDTLVTSKNMQTLKLLLPYIPESMQKNLAFYIKYTELKNTIVFFQHFDNQVKSQSFSESLSSPEVILTELSPYLDSHTRDMISNMQNTMELVKAFAENINMDDIDIFYSGNDNGKEKEENCP